MNAYVKNMKFCCYWNNWVSYIGKHVTGKVGVPFFVFLVFLIKQFKNGLERSHKDSFITVNEKNNKPGPGWQWKTEQAFRSPGGFGWKRLNGS